jgi:plasmid stabilization system protein ParE
VKPDRFDPEAAAEYAAAVLWYAERDVEVAARFRAHVLATIASVCESPTRSPNIRGVPKRLGVRRRLVARFPYAIVYMELEQEILILAVAHLRRRPAYWRGRLPPK